MRQRAKAEVISALKKHASESQLGQAVNAASAVKQYAVQLGVFRSEQNALKLKQQFTEVLGDKMGAQVRIELVNGLHKVVVGSGMTEGAGESRDSHCSRCAEYQGFRFKGVKDASEDL